MRLAAVDIGSNTVHSLVADVVRGKLEDVAHYVEEPELGPYVARTGAIGSRSKVAIQALRSVVERARSHSFDVLIAGATQAVRQATDRDAFVREAGPAIGVPVHVIPAEREAELSFLGVASRHAVRREWAMVDLGGGSTEVVIGQGQAMVRSTTLPIGSGVLASTYLSDPPRPEERARLRRAALREPTQAPDRNIQRLVGTGWPTADLPTCEARLDRARAAEVATVVKLPPSRVKAMRAGVEALLLLLDWYGLAVLHVSHQGLRHGMLLAYLERGNDWWR